MNVLLKGFLLYLLAINLLAFLLYGIDKSRAKRGKWRIRESVLILMSFLLGTIGSLAGMRLFHHKTLKKKFRIGVPAILILQIFCALAAAYYFHDYYHADQTALAALKGIYGVGTKVANCVLLFGLHHLNAFPVDVWIRKVLEEQYPGGYPYEEYSPWNGIYQQYMFAYYRNGYILTV